MFFLLSIVIIQKCQELNNMHNLIINGLLLSIIILIKVGIFKFKMYLMDFIWCMYFLVINQIIKELNYPLKISMFQLSIKIIKWNNQFK